jgi:methionyl-tRNA formyltransferase
MGTPLYAKVILQKLLEDSEIEVSLVLTQPDRPVGRKKTLTPPPVKELAQSHNIEVLQPLSLKDKAIIETLKSKKADFIIVAAYGMLLPKEVLELAPCINLHASILPQYRGASPIQQALLNGDEYSGVTAMLMDEGLDTGDILAFSFLKTNEAPTLPLMMEKLSFLAADLTVDVIKKFNKLLPLKQLNALASKCKKIKKEDGLVDFSSAEKLYRKYSAYFGWPGIFLESGLKLHDIELLDRDSTHKEGEILEIDKEYIIVACKKGTLKIKELQPKSKAKMAAYSYILGKRLKVGDTLL